MQAPTTSAPHRSQSFTTESRDLLERYRAIRARSEWLTEPLCPEDCVVQSMPDASPTKWHLGHTTWFFETLVTDPHGTRPFADEFRVLFNSYYNTIGKQHPRPRRGMLTRPSLSKVWAYRRHVDEQVQALLEPGLAHDDPRKELIEVGLHHEQQHQELILMDIKHLFSQNPLGPTYRETPLSEPVETARPTWVGYDEGLRLIGHQGAGFSYDNERPRHRVFLETFELASRLVTNEEYQAFIDDDGYRRPELWLADGWDTVQSTGQNAPLYWRKREDGLWWTLTLGGPRSVVPEEPVCHVSYFEADAYARWAGGRLPDEAEWETAAADESIAGNFVESEQLHPVPAPRDGAGEGPAQLFGNLWEWTRSAYSPYPGYAVPPGALGEYNGKFMCNQMVLRGGSCVTPESHIRRTYRNFFYPQMRWQFAGIRLARDAR